MVSFEFDVLFDKKVEKIRDQLLKDKVKKQIKRILDSPEIGKPMRFSRKGTREIYVPPFRLSYSYSSEENKIMFLDLYHKDEQ